MQPHLIRRAAIIFAVGLLILIVGLALPWWLQRGSDGGVSMVGEPAIGGSFELVDQHGNTLRDTDFHGRYVLIFFGYTYCPDFCPQTLLTVTEALDRLEEAAPAKAEEVVPVFVTIDPERDTVEAMAAYAEHFHEDLIALTGTPEQIDAAAKAYRVYYRKAEDESLNDYLMDHSTFVFLMDPEGKYIAHYTHGTKAEDMAASLQEQIEG
ncbi:MAG TPA: SCO family protein [Kiloniellales bacterium]|jgi:cytochrome oxidase Cu insertion factor (SCO1/SenC/PrrC family)|nr:SCO family protein [Kiloniellales bacterium]